MKNPDYLARSLGPIFLDQPLTHNTKIRLNEIDGTLNVSFPKTLKEKVSLIITSDLYLKKILLDFPTESNHSINLLYHFKKNEKREITFKLHPQSNVKIIESYLSIKPVKSDLTRVIELYHHAHLTLSSGVFMDGEHGFNDEILLKEIGARIDYDTLSIAHKQDSFKSTQNIRHLAKNTVSNVHNLMVVNHHAVIEFYVNGYIEKGMSGSNCKQQNRGVILSETGIVRVDPKLFIDEYDVEAGHGAAIGQINEDEMFYLLSRGLSESEAKRLILSGYTEPFVQSLDEGALKRTINQRIAKKVKGE